MTNSFTFVDAVAMLRKVLILFSYLIFLSLYPISSIYSAIPITVISVRAFNLIMFLLHQWKYHRRTQGLKESTSEIWILLLNPPGRECHCTDCFTISGADRNYYQLEGHTCCCIKHSNTIVSDLSWIPTNLPIIFFCEPAAVQAV